MNALVRDLFVAFLFTACASAHAATISAASLSPADVQAALNQAQAGDTVVLPAGSANWTTGVSRSVPANVIIKGGGTATTGGGDQTIIQDNIASGSQLLNIHVPSTGVFRLTGVTFRSGSGAIKDGGTINFEGPGKTRIDHCHFIASSRSNYKMIRLGSGVFGLMDHCILDFTDENSIYIYNGRTGSGDWMGNLEWSLPTNFGSDEYFYIEDNIINGYASGGRNVYATRIFDGFTAAKVVVRFNNVSQAVLGETHATGHAPDDRGLRSQEIYGNKVTSSLQRDPNYGALDMGNGTTLIWGNTWDQVYKNIYLFKQTRKSNATYTQTVPPNGWGYSGTQFNGTGSNWDGGTTLGTDTTLGYPCLDQPGRGQGDLITGGFPNKVNSTTSTIRWPNQALEPIYIWNNTGSNVSGWGGAIYSNDSGGRVAANRDYYPPASGAQTSPTSPFNGTSGTGWGTLANRPTTATPGVAYFATDQGSWNTSTSNAYGVQQNGADGVLYKCTAPNTWTPYYTPYTYPHPLQTGGVSSSPPTGGVSSSPPTDGVSSSPPTDGGSSGPPPPPSNLIVVASSTLTIWPSSAVPGVVDSGPDGAVQLGVKFRSDVAGTIRGIRFYKASTNTGTHVGSLWSSTGTRLANATFTDETASGWQQVNFTTPVAIDANTVYVASYHTTTGHYSFNYNYFSGSGADNTPLHALATGVSGGNGVYVYGGSNLFPNQTWNASNYWVDVVFQPN